MPTRDDTTRYILNKIRGLQEGKTFSDGKKQLLSEEKEKEKSDANAQAVAITDDPKWGQNVLTNQIEQFRSSVDSGAEFTKPEESDITECPLLFIKKTKNLVFSGTIPSLNNLKWQFVLKTSTGNGCFFWTDGCILSKENLQTLSKLLGFYQNWKEEWNKEAADIDKMVANLDSK